MNDKDNEQTTDKDAKPHVKDLEARKDVKGGGALKPQSPGTGGTQTQPVPVPGQGS